MAVLPGRDTVMVRQATPKSELLLSRKAGGSGRRAEKPHLSKGQKECKTVSINTVLRIHIFVKPSSPSSFPSTFISLSPARVLQSPLNLYFPSRLQRPHLHVRIPCSSTRPKSLIVLQTEPSTGPPVQLTPTPPILESCLINAGCHLSNGWRDPIQQAVCPP